MWNPISSVPWKDMSEKVVKHKSERLARQCDGVQHSKNETHGWCKTTVKVKARTRVEVSIDKIEILTYSQ